MMRRRRKFKISDHEDIYSRPMLNNGPILDFFLASPELKGASNAPTIKAF